MNNNINVTLVKLASELEEALQSDREEKIHNFLAKHPQILQQIFGPGLVESKFHLADAYVTDFLSIDGTPSNSPKVPVYFIEIERPNLPLFTKSGDPSSYLTHALRQVQNWKQWISENRNYIAVSIQQLVARMKHYFIVEETQKDKSMKRIYEGIRDGLVHGFRDNYVVIAGRRESMTIPNRLLLGQMNNDLNGVRIMTYDTIVDIFVLISGGIPVNLRHFLP
jgi:hypothetical protein